MSIRIGLLIIDIFKMIFIQPVYVGHCHRDAGVGHVIRFNIRVCLLADALIAHLIFQHVTGFGVNNDVILPLEAKRGAA